MHDVLFNPSLTLGLQFQVLSVIEGTNLQSLNVFMIIQCTEVSIEESMFCLIVFVLLHVKSVFHLTLTCSAVAVTLED
jgi:hypothetical protein